MCARENNIHRVAQGTKHGVFDFCSDCIIVGLLAILSVGEWAMKGKWYAMDVDAVDLASLKEAGETIQWRDGTYGDPVQKSPERGGLSTRVDDDGTVFVIGVAQYCAANQLTLRQVKEKLEAGGMEIDLLDCRDTWKSWGWETESINQWVSQNGWPGTAFADEMLAQMNKLMEEQLLTEMVSTAGLKDTLEPIGECHDQIGGLGTAEEPFLLVPTKMVDSMNAALVKLKP